MALCFCKQKTAYELRIRDGSSDGCSSDLPGVESRWGVTGPYERLSLLLTEVIRSGRSPVEVGRDAGRRARRAPATGEDEIDAVADAMARQIGSASCRDRVCLYA